METLVSTETLSHEEWLKWRNKGIGGSDVSVICGLNKYKSAVELWLEKTGQIVPEEVGEAATWGILLEPLIRNEFTVRTGYKVELMMEILQHSEFPFMLANIDGYIYNEESKKYFLFEAKTASAFLSGMWELTIPEEYQLQVQHYMAVTGLTGAYVAVLIGGQNFKYYFIERDDEIINLLIKLERQFWDCVVNNKTPQIDGSKASSDLLNRLHPLGMSKDIIILPENAAEIIKRFEEFQDAESVAAIKKEEAINQLKEMLSDNEYGSADGHLVCWTNVSTERLNTKALKTEEPDLYKKYLATSTSRRFSIRQITG